MIAGVEQIFHLAYEVVHWTIQWTCPAYDRLHVHEGGVKVSGAKVTELKHGGYWYHRRLSKVYTDNIKRKVQDLEVQTLTTKDGKSVRVQGVLIYHIRNIATWLIENEAPADGLLTDAMRVLSDFVRSKNFEDLRDWNPEKRKDDELTRSGQSELGQDFGVHIRHLGIINGPVETTARDLFVSGSTGIVDSGEEE